MHSGNSAFDVIVLDSSVLYAIILEETGFKQYLGILDRAKKVLIGAPTLAEAGLVVQSRQGPPGLARLLQLLERWNVRVDDFTKVHALEAIDAYHTYGKGRHPAALNMGECNSYATAKVAGASLLYKGNDFAQTDLPKLTPPA